MFAIIATALIVNLSGDVATNPEASRSSDSMSAQEQADHQQNAALQASNFPLFGDGLAQWLMVVVSVFATGVSFVAVLLVKRTLDTSRAATEAAIKTLEVTRDIGTRQLRPYIMYDRASFAVLQTVGGPEAFLEIKSTFRNCGMSPGIITAASGSVYAPAGKSGWKWQGGQMAPQRIVIGPNQTGDMRFKGIDRAQDGTFSWFAIGILVWYEAIDGASYEDHVWLTFDGRDLRQDFGTSGYTLYRPEQDEYRD